MLKTTSTKTKRRSGVVSAMSLCGITLLLAVWFFAAPVSASELAVTFKTDVYSIYMWRGLNLCDEMVIQPSLTIGKAPVSLNIWSSFAGAIEGRCQELDYTLDYTAPFGKHQINLGYIYYTFPPNDDRSQEVFAGITLNEDVPFSLKAYYDYDEGSGLYFEAGSVFPMTVGKTNVPISVAVGYNHRQWWEGSGLSHAQVSISKEYTASRVTVTPIVAYSEGFHDEFPDECYYGVALLLR